MRMLLGCGVMVPGGRSAKDISLTPITYSINVFLFQTNKRSESVLNKHFKLEELLFVCINTISHEFHK